MATTNKTGTWRRIETAPQKSTQQVTIAVVVSLVVASILLFFPLSINMALFRPPMMFLVVVFWVIIQPMRFGIWFAFMVGLLCDVLLDTHIGQNALAFCCAVFLINLMNERKEKLSFAMNWIYAIIAIVCYLLVINSVDIAIARHIQFAYWQSVLPSILTWPILYAFLHRYK